MLISVQQTKKLTFLYLANDVIQTSKKKGPEFSQEFEGVLPYAFHHVLKEADEKMRHSCERILDVWKDRGIYDLGFINAIKLTKDRGSSEGKGREPENNNRPTPILKKPRSDEDKSKKAKSKSKSRSEDGDEPKEKKAKKEKKSKTPGPEFPLDMLQKDLEQDGKSEDEVKPPEPIDLVNALLQLETSASNDEVIRAKIASYPPSIADVSLLKNLQNKTEGERLRKQVEEASLLLAEYNGRLMAELEERKEVAQMLQAFMKLQKDKMAEAEKSLEGFKLKMEKVIKVRKELQSHIQNLPDLNLLPDVTGGLAPLPSADKLFN